MLNSVFNQERLKFLVVLFDPQTMTSHSSHWAFHVFNEDKNYFLPLLLYLKNN